LEEVHLAVGIARMVSHGIAGRGGCGGFWGAGHCDGGGERLIADIMTCDYGANEF
jgi:hypothetical protein